VGIDTVLACNPLKSRGIGGGVQISGCDHEGDLVVELLGQRH